MLSTESLKIEINVPVRMRDGAVLYADVYRPDDGRRHPAVLTRLPYNKSVEFPTCAGYLNPLLYARAGYAVVVQDVRGTGSSEGTASFWQQEVQDGYDSVEAIAGQPWCDGNIGMFGYSYFGYTQWAAAVARPPHLKAICPCATNTFLHGHPFSIRGDKMRLQIHYVWTLMISSLGLLRPQKPPAYNASTNDRLTYLTDHRDDLSRFLPLKDSPVIQTVDELGMVPRFSDLILHANDAEYWQKFGTPLPLDKVVTPPLHIVGWYDIDMVPAVLNSYLALEKFGAIAGKKLPQKLVIGPWVHTADMPNKVGELDFGLSSSGGVADIAGQQIRWYDHWLKGLANGVVDEPPVRIFVMGDNRWRDENEWPLARTQYRQYYFHSRGRANTLSGDGSLSPAAPVEEQSDSYLYDPRKPVLTHKMGAGAYDRHEVEIRPDVLVYTSDALNSDLEVTGPVQIKLWAASSAVDTDFAATLVDVWPDGRAYNVAEGITRAGFVPPSSLHPIVPGEINQYSIDLGATSNVFKAGHRIRVEITSSNFPRWDLNLNTGQPIGLSSEIKLALQSIFHQGQYPSHIILPVV